jgi:hypothetical protein
MPGLDNVPSVRESPRTRPPTWKGAMMSDGGILVVFALALVLLHTPANGQYGFHRDEMAFPRCRRPSFRCITAPPAVNQSLAKDAVAAVRSASVIWLARQRRAWEPAARPSASLAR